MRDDFDRSSHWLITHHGDSILRLAGITNIESWRPIPPEVVQPRKIPDGLVEITVARCPQPVRCLIEIATYPERRVSQQMRDDALHSTLAFGLPELITLVLHPKGRLRVAKKAAWRSPLGTAQLMLRWHVIELWRVPSTELLACGDVGVIPWVPLTKLEDTPDNIIRACKDRIERVASPEDRPNLLAVTQVLARLSFDDPSLFRVLGGRDTMIESPLIQELVAEARTQDIIEVLRQRFGPVNGETCRRLEGISDEKRLLELVSVAAKAKSFIEFEQALLITSGRRGKSRKAR